MHRFHENSSDFCDEQFDEQQTVAPRGGNERGSDCLTHILFPATATVAQRYLYTSSPASLSFTWSYFVSPGE
jgi:hypothetical protein